MVMNRDVFSEPNVLPGDGGVLENAIAALATAGEVGAYLHQGYWQTMDTLREKQELEAAWQKGDAPWTKHWQKP
jgi:glucose-1-phosphate cytidylyltransferase